MFYIKFYNGKWVAPPKDVQIIPGWPDCLENE